jgi:hypothetical protein
VSRYYDIIVSAAPKAPTIPTTPGPTIIGAVASNPVIHQWTSFPNGVNDPGALDVEFDFFSSTSGAPGSQNVATLTIHGISLTDLFQAPKYTNMNVTVRGGMQAGLPLANPAQAGIIWQGIIYQSFGNWVGTDMTLDFVMFPGALYTIREPGNFVLNWPAGTTLQAALTSMLGVAYPTLPPPIFTIGSQYILSYNVLHAVSTFKLMAEYVLSITNSITPPGVNMVIRPDNKIYVFDNSTPQDAKPIAFTDLIGQPTWIDANVMQFTTVMRGDIQVGTQVSMPQGLGAPGTVSIANPQQSLPSQLGPQYKTAFQGKFLVTSIRFIGNFRDPNGASWATVFQCVPAIPIVPGSAGGG